MANPLMRNGAMMQHLNLPPDYHPLAFKRFVRFRGLYAFDESHFDAMNILIDMTSQAFVEKHENDLSFGIVRATGELYEFGTEEEQRWRRVNYVSDSS